MAQRPSLIPATPDDIAAIMAIERGPGFEELVGRWPAAEHEAEMAKAGSRYFLWSQAGSVAGFALVQDLDSPHDAAYLKRIAVAEPGRGIGGQLLAALLDWLFASTAINRLSLGVFPENERAVSAYRRLGFETEGLSREAYRRPDGSYRSSLQMAILRRDWLGRHSSVEKRESSTG